MKLEKAIKSYEDTLKRFPDNADGHALYAQVTVEVTLLDSYVRNTILSAEIATFILWSLSFVKYITLDCCWQHLCRLIMVCHLHCLLFCHSPSTYFEIFSMFSLLNL
jgi:hypothetical protein